MSIYSLITQAENFNTELCNANRVIETTYQGLPVYRVNSAVGGKNAPINLRNYFFTESTIKTHDVNITAERFREQVSSTNKKGICLHYTVAPIRSALRHLTGVIEYYEDGITIKKEQWTSVPFMICHAGNIYQLSNPDTDLSWHLSPRIYGGDSIWLHNQIIGIELCNWGTDVQNVTDSSHIITLSQEYRGKTRFETFTEEQYVSLNKLIDAISCK